MPPEITDWITSLSAVGAVLAAIYIARKQISIQNRQADIQDKQADYQKQQTNISKLQADVSRTQTDLQKQQTEIIDHQTEIAEQQLEIAKQQLEIIRNQEKARLAEKTQANLTAKIEKRPRSNGRGFDYFLLIKNEGPADARDVTAYLGDYPISKHRNVLPSSLPSTISQLAAGTNIEYRLIFTDADSGTLNVDVRWADDFDTARQLKTTLNAF